MGGGLRDKYGDCKDGIFQRLPNQIDIPFSQKGVSLQRGEIRLTIKTTGLIVPTSCLLSKSPPLRNTSVIYVCRPSGKQKKGGRIETVG